MSKINVYSSSASNAIKVFDASSTGLKPDNAILVTTGTEPSNAIQINVGEKKWSSIAVNFGGSEPGPTPPGPTPPGPTPFPYSTVVIGDDEWTSENISWDDNGEGIYKKENVVINGVNYGTVYFYNAEAALRLFNNIEEIYPGWHIATKDDVDTLITEVNEDNSSLRTTTGWNDDMNGTDSNGFHAEPLGNIYKEDDYEEWNNVGESYDLWMNNLYEGNPDFDCVEHLNKDNNFYIEWDIDDYNSYYPIRLVKKHSSDKHKITIKPSTNGSVSATPSEGNPGTVVTLSNTPNNYYSFEKYNITGATLTGNYFEIGNSDVDVQGVFVADKYNVSYTNDGHGSLTGTLTTATGGMTTTLTATPNTHYNLNNITVTGGIVNGNILTVTSNCTANASYVPKQYTVTYQTNGNGTLTGGVTTATGNSTTTLTATPNTHYSFSNYSVTGGTINGNILTITANCTAKANFTMIQPYTLTLQQQTGGSIGSTKTTGYSGDTVTLSNTPSALYAFNSYSVTGGTLTNNVYTFGNQNGTAKANFIYTPVPASGQITRKNLTWTKQPFCYNDGGSGIKIVNNPKYTFLHDGGASSVYNLPGPMYYYNYDAAERISRNISGWHLPTLDDWRTLTGFNQASQQFMSNDTLKYWYSAYWYVDNYYNFSAIPYSQYSFMSATSGGKFGLDPRINTGAYGEWLWTSASASVAGWTVHIPGGRMEVGCYGNSDRTNTYLPMLLVKD